MNISRAIEFVFDDEEWLGKILLAAVISLIPVFGPVAASGYVIALVRNVMAGKENPLPDWEEPGRCFRDGLMFWLATLLYALPLLLLACPVVLSWALPLFGAEDSEATWALLGLSGALTAALGCLVTPVLQIRYAEVGTIGACLRVGAVLRFLLDNFGRILLVTLVVTLAVLLVTLVFGGVFTVLVLIPLCGPVVAAFGAMLLVPVYLWLGLFGGHLSGQIGRRAGVTAFAS
jgi:MFS family permease